MIGESRIRRESRSSTVVSGVPTGHGTAARPLAGIYPPLGTASAIGAMWRQPNSSLIQTAPNIGRSADRYELEADRVAARVMRHQGTNETARHQRQAGSRPFAIGRRAHPDSVAGKPAADERAAQLATTSPATHHHPGLRGAGHALSAGERAFFESRFGYDFSRVRIHRDQRANELSDSVAARAFTVGRDVVFGPGQYAPGNAGGRHLLAHELTHVVQQGHAERSRHAAIPTFATQSPRLQLSPSRLIPDLERRTVSALESGLPMARGDVMQQQMLDLIVADRRGKGTNFSIMARGHPVASTRLWTLAMAQRTASVGTAQLNGVTVPPRSPPVNSGRKPLVLIGPSVFGPIRDRSNMTMVRRFVVRLYSTVMHEYQHARQWQRPAHARAMGQARREVDAFFWEIEHSQQTGLRGQTQSFRQIWREAQGWWRRLRRSTAWRRLSVADRQRYTDWHQRVARIASSVLNTRP